MNKLAVLLLVVAACSDTTQPGLDSQTLNRPIDIAFACYGGLRVTNGAAPTKDQAVTVSAQPIRACETASQPYDSTMMPKPTVAGQEQIDGATPVPDTGWYGFILQSEPGTVAHPVLRDPRAATQRVQAEIGRTQLVFVVAVEC